MFARVRKRLLLRIGDRPARRCGAIFCTGSFMLDVTARTWERSDQSRSNGRRGRSGDPTPGTADSSNSCTYRRSSHVYVEYDGAIELGESTRVAWDPTLDVAHVNAALCNPVGQWFRFSF